MPMSLPRNWAAADGEILADMWAAGHSAKEIARRLGKTKNSIIGRAHRIGLAARPSLIAGRAAKMRKPRALDAQKGPLKRSEISPLAALPIPALPAELPEVEWGRCQFIFSDPRVNASKCGAPAVRGRAWCSEHLAIVYTLRAP